MSWNMIDSVKDNIFPNWHLCPKLNHAVQNGKDSEEYKQFLEQANPSMAMGHSEAWAQHRQALNTT